MSCWSSKANGTPWTTTCTHYGVACSRQFQQASGTLIDSSHDIRGYLHSRRDTVSVCGRVVAPLDITVFTILPDHQHASINPAAILGQARIRCLYDRQSDRVRSGGNDLKKLWDAAGKLANAAMPRVFDSVVPKESRNLQTAASQLAVLRSLHVLEY